ncbi:GNAT family N-acetyltransferase [Fulvivirga lutimaris]|uniref:GNAT family N-acetyltransferase n=1 Tax=Fulvivirga lutimaris TaxID=1819566 RepID=UPI0012BB81A3|nr:GNAT family N-acetyltransferase [Fulvivirga lutimaris]MTI39733.1 GNAT family N-acetyltransferase [Fulvivirga lutimaris]
MADSIYIKNLKPVDLTEMYITFLDAFSDYAIPFKLTKEQFVRKFVQKLKIDFNLSAGAFNYDGSLIGFIFSAVNYYDGKLTAYNGGTGVRPRYRGQQLTTQMYEYLAPLFNERKIKQCVLEVLTSNDRAIKAYQNIGFEKTRFFKCYILTDVDNLKVGANRTSADIFAVRYPNWDVYDKFCDYQPSFLDSSRMISDNLANETIIEARIDDECVGFAIFQPSFGRISQIGIKSDVRRKGIGSAIINYIFEASLQKKLTIINVNDEAEGTKSFFTKLGFDNQIDQYEMILSL